QARRSNAPSDQGAQALAGRAHQWPRAHEPARQMSRAATAIVLALATTATATVEARAPRTSAAEHAAAEHVAAANRAFQAGSYETALAQLRIAYQLAPRPEFLLTFAQIYRAAGRLEQALEACNSYLAMVPDGPMGAGAKKLAEMLKAEIAARAPSPPP